MGSEDVATGQFSWDAPCTPSLRCIAIVSLLWWGVSHVLISRCCSLVRSFRAPSFHSLNSLDLDFWGLVGTLWRDNRARIFHVLQAFILFPVSLCCFRQCRSFSVVLEQQLFFYALHRTGPTSFIRNGEADRRNPARISNVAPQKGVMLLYSMEGIVMHLNTS